MSKEYHHNVSIPLESKQITLANTTDDQNAIIEKKCRWYNSSLQICNIKIWKLLS